MKGSTLTIEALPHDPYPALAVVYDCPVMTVLRLEPGVYRATILEVHEETMQADDDAEAVTAFAVVAHQYLCDDADCRRCEPDEHEVVA